MGVSWEEMCQQVVIDGRPGDVASAALGWTELLKNLRSVKESLEKNTADLGAVWKGPAFDAFKTHIDGVAKTTGQLIDDAEEGDGIVHSLNAAADRLTEAQREFPIPASCVNDVLEARNGHLTIGVGFFEAKVAPDFLGLLDPIAGLADWLNDRTDEAAQVYERVNNQYQGQAGTMPGETSALPTQQNPNLETPNLNTGGGGGGTGSVPSLPGGPGTGRPPGTPDVPSTTNPDLSTPNPDLDRDPDHNLPDTTTPGLDTSPPGTVDVDEEQYGSGLASAGPTTGVGGGGLPSTAGLGSGGGLGGGAGSGSVPGGGALGRPVATMMPPMMGGGAAGAGKGGGRGAGGKLGAGGRLGAGMAPGMLGGAGGAGGRGAGGGRGTGATATGARGAGGRGGLVGGAGAGYGEDEATRSTWLDEDEDVWGADGDSLPGILR
ncbi:WXG100 family type VII secretion target [Micromonospora sagamiensis]|uniref:Uncharacterized protein n=1 Tax=Micromonospora sagamiensis TaxID=47875 RepID=A0A562WPC1_9ACTN|nr:hypothetical protein [Micromonospora sagamiensis]TWJ31254.1 hypothetical protein JD81_04809 [Micromonospora sagamiensis]BCL15701.1 hypothetical protein GCM10017556_34400 [Micromonospora sagamiensis]